jgi:NAD(P)-dependent dehydrogenase (short-subunit alcohol dehydrogenase family)
LITGGSSGLGKEIARQLLSQGASVTIIARRLEQLKEAKAELQSSECKGSRLEIVSADVTDVKSSESMLKEAESLQKSPVDYVFCCAGAAIPGFFVEQDPSVFAKQMNLNYLGAINTIHVNEDVELFKLTF